MGGGGCKKAWLSVRGMTEGKLQETLRFTVVTNFFAEEPRGVN